MVLNQYLTLQNSPLTGNHNRRLLSPVIIQVHTQVDLGIQCQVNNNLYLPVGSPMHSLPHKLIDLVTRSLVWLILGPLSILLTGLLYQLRKSAQLTCCCVMQRSWSLECCLSLGEEVSCSLLECGRLFEEIFHFII